MNPKSYVFTVKLKYHGKARRRIVIYPVVPEDPEG
jgi:hypothetical protein